MLQVNGHYIAKLDPLGLDQRPTPVELDLALYGFSDKDMDREYAPSCSLSLSLPHSMLFPPLSAGRNQPGPKSSPHCHYKRTACLQLEPSLDTLRNA